jgi:predicted ATPase
MLQRSRGDIARHAGAQRPVFFDRGLPDLIGYARLFELDPTPAQAAAAGCRYNDVVFALPAWPEIYVNDAERRMSFQDAAAFGEQVQAIYQELGYALVEVPRASVAERAAFVLRAVAELSQGSRVASAG